MWESRILVGAMIDRCTVLAPCSLSTVVINRVRNSRYDVRFQTDELFFLDDVLEYCGALFFWGA